MKTTNGLQLKILLKDSKPPIWRRVLVKSNISFYELHHTIQCVMGWENYHLFEFNIDNYRIGETDEDFGMNERLINAKEVGLSDILVDGGIEKFSYTYDFGDNWKHEITVEKTLSLDENEFYPKCIKGKMNCPPEDCGGIPGYTHMVNVMKQKEGQEYRDFIEWYENFDPNHFDVEEANFQLRDLDEIIKLDERMKESVDPENDFVNALEENLDFLNLLPSLNVNIVNKSKHGLPEYKTEESAGMDLRANLDQEISLKPLERTLVKTGLFIELPKGAEAQVRPRSGLAIKHGITVLNTPGTIDSDYRGEIGVILVNLSSETYTIKDGERIAQLVIAQHERAEWNEVDKLDDTDRGEGGFGSTGI